MTWMPTVGDDNESPPAEPTDDAAVVDQVKEIAVLGPVQPGSIVVLRGDGWDAPEWTDPTEHASELYNMIAGKVSHEAFLLIRVPVDADLQLYGPDYLVEALADAVLERARKVRADRLLQRIGLGTDAPPPVPWPAAAAATEEVAP